MIEFIHSDFLTLSLYVLGGVLAWRVLGHEKTARNRFERLILSVLWPTITIVSCFMATLFWLFED